MGKALFIIAAISTVISLVFLAWYFSLVGYYWVGTSYDQMSTTELREIAIDWNYRDLLRNHDEYNGKVIFIEGIITRISSFTSTSLTLCETSDNSPSNYILAGPNSRGQSNCGVMFVSTNEGDWLKGDRISGFVEFSGMSKCASEGCGHFIGGVNERPGANGIKLTCHNC